MKVLRNIFIAFIVLALVAGSFCFLYMKPRRVTPILMYHSISKDKSSTLNVSPGNFFKQMQFLEKAGYAVISLDELVERIKHGQQYIPKTVVITFDDGKEDNYLYAFPVLSRYKMPATIFLITGYIGGKEGYLDWHQVRLMVSGGMNFGGHTRNNLYLPSIKDEKDLWNEIAGARKDINLNAAGEAYYFCYPTGGFNEKIKETVEKAGYKGACTTNRGSDRLNHDVYELNRVKITNSDMTKPFHFRAKLSGYYNIFRRLRSGE